MSTIGTASRTASGGGKTSFTDGSTEGGGLAVRLIIIALMPGGVSWTTFCVSAMSLILKSLRCHAATPVRASAATTGYTSAMIKTAARTASFKYLSISIRSVSNAQCRNYNLSTISQRALAYKRLPPPRNPSSSYVNIGEHPELHSTLSRTA